MYGDIYYNFLQNYSCNIHTGSQSGEGLFKMHIYHLHKPRNVEYYDGEFMRKKAYSSLHTCILDTRSEKKVCHQA